MSIDLKMAVRTMRLRRTLPNEVFCPLGKIICQPEVRIELSYIKSPVSPIPFRDLDAVLEGFTNATYEEIAETVATRLVEKYHCRAKVVVGDDRFEAEFLGEE